MPHLGVADRVKETTTTTGTGTIDLAGAVEGYQTFVAGIGNGHETYYSISNRDADEWEVGYGTITDAATDTLSRSVVISSSNGGSLVNFSAGTKDVICTLPADKSFVIDDEANVSVTANVTATSFDGSGAALTSLNASNVSSGTLPNARLDAQLQDIAGLATTSGKIIQGDGANFVLSSYTIPTSDGTTGQVLTTNGSGAVTFQTPTVGDITAVTAGSGLTGGGTTGDVTLNVGAGTGVTVNADDIAIGQDVATSASPTFAGGTFTANVALGDLDHILMGATGEYQIYHDHANGVSVIKDVDAGGSINIDADTISLTGGNVGIGTSSPDTPLHINGGTANRVAKFVSTDNNAYISFEDNSTTGLTYIGGTADDLYFGTDGSERVRIDSSGNVGIGTTSPSSELTLGSNSTIEMLGGSSVLKFTREDTTTIAGNPLGAIEFAHTDTDDAGVASKIIGQGDGSSGEGRIAFYTGTPSTLTERMRIDSSGDVLIGATTTASSDYGAKFLVDGSSEILAIHRQASDGDFIQFARGGSDSGNIKHSSGNLVINAVNDFEIQTNDGTDVVHVGSNGYVGIGTTGPQRLLHVQAASGDAFLRVETDGTGAGDHAVLELRTTNTSASSYIYFGDSADTNAGMIRYGHSNDFMSFTVNTSEAMRIDSDGNVGIGTSSPTARIHGIVGADWNSTNYSFIFQNQETQNSYGNTVRIIGGGGAGAGHSSSNILAVGDNDDNIDFVVRGDGNVGIGTSSPSQTLDVAGTILTDKAYIALATLTDGATINWDMADESVAKVTLGGNRTIAAPTNGSTGQFASITVIQDGTGSRTLTWNAVYEFKDDTAPTLTTTGGKGDLFVFQYNGTKWLEVGRNLNLTQS